MKRESPHEPRILTVVCPHCQRKLRVRAELAARRGKCPGCGKILEIPAAEFPSPKAAPKLRDGHYVALPVQRRLLPWVLGAAGVLSLAILAAFALSSRKPVRDKETQTGPLADSRASGGPRPSEAKPALERQKPPSESQSRAVAVPSGIENSQKAEPGEAPPPSEAKPALERQKPLSRSERLALEIQSGIQSRQRAALEEARKVDPPTEALLNSVVSLVDGPVAEPAVSVLDAWADRARSADSAERRAAEAALVRILEDWLRDPSAPLPRRRLAVLYLVRRDGPQVDGTLESQISKAELLDIASEGLARRGNEETVVRGLRSERALVRGAMAAASRFLERPSSRVIDRLEELAKSGEPWVRHMAVEALASAVRRDPGQLAAARALARLASAAASRAAKQQLRLDRDWPELLIGRRAIERLFRADVADAETASSIESALKTLLAAGAKEPSRFHGDLIESFGRSCGRFLSRRGRGGALVKDALRRWEKDGSRDASALLRWLEDSDPKTLQVLIQEIERGPRGETRVRDSATPRRALLIRGEDSTPAVLKFVGTAREAKFPVLPEEWVERYLRHPELAKEEARELWQILQRTDDLGTMRLCADALVAMGPLARFLEGEVVKMVRGTTANQDAGAVSHLGRILASMLRDDPRALLDRIGKREIPLDGGFTLAIQTLSLRDPGAVREDERERWIDAVFGLAGAANGLEQANAVFKAIQRWAPLVARGEPRTSRRRLDSLARQVFERAQGPEAGLSALLHAVAYWPGEPILGELAASLPEHYRDRLKEFLDERSGSESPILPPYHLELTLRTALGLAEPASSAKLRDDARKLSDDQLLQNLAGRPSSVLVGELRRRAIEREEMLVQAANHIVLAQDLDADAKWLSAFEDPAPQMLALTRATFASLLSETIQAQPHSILRGFPVGEEKTSVDILLNILAAWESYPSSVSREP